MATLYVTPTGSDSNNGTSIGTSKLTISGAIDIASNGSGNGYGNGDTILVYPSASADATYYESLLQLQNFGAAEAIKKNLTIQAVTSSYNVTINAERDNYIFKMYHYTILRGFILTGSITFACQSSNGNDNTLRNKYDQCTFTGLLEGSAVSAPGQSEVVACKFQTITASAASVLTSGNSTATSRFNSCIFQDCHFDGDTGFIVYNGMGTNEQLTIDSCHVTDSSGGQSSIAGTNRADGNTFYNCIVSNSNYNSSGYAIYAADGGTVKNCVVYNSTNGSAANRVGGGTVSDTSNDDPGYVDAAEQNFNITANGSAYNGGTSDATIAGDFSGSAWGENVISNLDIQTTRNRDIGALALSGAIWQVSATGYDSGSFVSSDFTIQNISDRDVPLVRDSATSGYPQTNQTPVSMNIPGVPTLRYRHAAYKVTTGKD